MLIETLSVFPEMFETVMSTSILGRARKAGLFEFKAYNLRDWTHDRHRTVDDEPYGGGQGMLMKVRAHRRGHRGYWLRGPQAHRGVLYTVRRALYAACGRATCA